jgi:hypothetical protein
MSESDRERASRLLFGKDSPLFAEAVTDADIAWFAEALSAVRAEEREEAAQIAESYRHLGPFDWTKPEDRAPMYSNKTCEHIASAIRARGAR